MTDIASAQAAPETEANGPTLVDSLVDELDRLVTGLKAGTDPGSGAREYLNGIQRDLFVLEEAAIAAKPPEEEGELAAWLLPFLDALVAKLELGPRLLPDHRESLAGAAQRVWAIRDRDGVVASLREHAPPLLAGLHPEARSFLQQAGVEEALASPRLLLGLGPAAAPPEVALCARLLEGLGLHLALMRCEGREDPQSAAVDALAARLTAWLAKHPGVGSGAPKVGSTPNPASVRALPAAAPAAGVRRGGVVETVAPGHAWSGSVLARPVVVVSPGIAPRVLGCARGLLEEVAPEDARQVRPGLEASAALLSERLEDAAASPEAVGAAALDVVETVLPVLGAAEARTQLLAALVEDLPREAGSPELLLPSPGTPMSEGTGWEARDVFSAEVEPGIIVQLVRPGLKLGETLVRPALVRVSQGPPPPGTIDEVLELLPPDDARATRLRERLERARCLAAGDAGAQLARELADLTLAMRDETLGEAASRALRLTLEEPPQTLVGTPGWEAVQEFLSENLDVLLEDGENGELAAYRLIRPYLQGLRTHRLEGARLRALGESMSPLLSLYDEHLAAEARTWLFSELARLAGEGGLPPGGHAQRLVRTAARAIGGFYRDGEPTPAMELTQALAGAGVKVYPEEAERLERCPAPGARFHRLDARYSEEDRFVVLGEFEPAATTGQAGGEEGVTETGAIALSLGSPPELIRWLEAEGTRGSRLGPAVPRLIEEVTRLDRERLLGELSGQADTERLFAKALGELFSGVLLESGWSRSDDEREPFARLFEVLEQQHHLLLLPGYQSYRRLKELREGREGELALELVREGARRVELSAIGSMYRDELLQPMQMLWGAGPPPPYVAHLRQSLSWFAAILDERDPGIAVPPGVVEAVQDFESPDAGSLEGVVQALATIVSWLASREPELLEPFCAAVKEAPRLELDFFPLPGQAYPSKRLLAALDQATTADALEIVRDAAREDGAAIRVDRIAVYKDGRLISEEPQARFALKSLPHVCQDLQRALEPVLESPNVLGVVKARLRGLLTRLALVGGDEEGARDVELKALRTLLDARLVDPTYAEDPENALFRAGAFLVEELEAAGVLKVERFSGKETIAAALEGYDADASAEIETVFCSSSSNELVEVRRPLVILEGQVIQKAFLLRGLATDADVVLEFDQVLVDTIDRLRSWQEGPGALINASLEKKQQQVLPRTVKRISDVRRKMLRAAKKGKTADQILPADTARRDLIRFVIDQVHRSEDALALQENRAFRGQFGELVFKDVVFRGAGPYLSKTYGIDIDTDVVAGADTQRLVGRFKKESSGPRPKREHRKIYSVVLPCYKQEGVCIRPATVRLGEY